MKNRKKKYTEILQNTDYSRISKPVLPRILKTLFIVLAVMTGLGILTMLSASKKKGKKKDQVPAAPQPGQEVIKEDAAPEEEPEPEVPEVTEELPAAEEEKPKKKIHFGFGALTGLILFWMELLIHRAGGFEFSLPFLVTALLFSFSYGFIAEFVTSFIKGKARLTIRTFLLIFAAVIFLACFFVHKQFKVFYDLNTMLAGAGDAVGQFQSNIMEMICSAEGISMIVMCLLPAVLYAVFGRKYLLKSEENRRKARVSLAVSAAMFLCAAGCALAGPNAGIYTSQYSFERAVSSFGLLSALRLDVRKNIPLPEFFKEVTYTKLIHETDGSASGKLQWVKNEMDFDWDTLDASADKNQAALNKLVRSSSASSKNDYTGLFEGKNLIMITAEAFSGDIVSEELTPVLYRLSHNGIMFTDYYQPASAGTTGGEYEIIFGNLPTNGGRSLKNTASYNNYMTMGAQLDRLGYEGWAFHNNTYTFYDRHLTHNNLGYSHGYMGYGSGMEEYVKWQWPESDVEMLKGTMPMYENADHFNVYYMSVSGHNGYDYGSNAMSKKNWDRVKNLNCSERLKGYYAANLELEDALAYMVSRLEELGKADDTVIVISADHFPYGLDDGAGLGQMPYLSELYGHNVTDYLDRDHNMLIIWSGSLEKEEPIVVDTPVSSLDILPTLSNLFGTEFDSRLFPGRDVFSDAMPLVFTITYDWKTDLGSYSSITNKFTPAEGAVIPDGYVDKIAKIVRNKISWCTAYNNTDYFGYLFGK